LPLRTTSACKVLDPVVDQKVCTITPKDHFTCKSPGKCVKAGTVQKPEQKFEMDIQGAMQLNAHPPHVPDVAGCMGSHTAQELKIDRVVLKDGKLFGATAAGTYKYEGGQSQSSTVALNNNYFDCAAFDVSAEKLALGYNSNANAALLTTAVEAQADFIAEIQYTLAREYGLKFNGLIVKVSITAEAQVVMQGSLSFTELKAKVGAGAKMAATGGIQTKYFGATGHLNVGAYAEAGILIKFDEGWNFNFDLSFGCLLGSSFEMQLAVGDMAYDLANYITGSAATASLLGQWSDANSPFQQSEGDVEYKAGATLNRHSR